MSWQGGHEVNSGFNFREAAINYILHIQIFNTKNTQNEQNVLFETVLDSKILFLYFRDLEYFNTLFNCLKS